MGNIIESKRYIPCITEEEINFQVKDNKFIFICPLPNNLSRIISCETDDKEKLCYVIKENSIKVVNNYLKPFTVYYEVSKSQIIENLIQEINDKLKKVCK